MIYRRDPRLIRFTSLYTDARPATYLYLRFTSIPTRPATPCFTIYIYYDATRDLEISTLRDLHLYRRNPQLTLTIYIYTDATRDPARVDADVVGRDRHDRARGRVHEAHTRLVVHVDGADEHKGVAAARRAAALAAHHLAVAADLEALIGHELIARDHLRDADGEREASGLGLEASACRLLHLQRHLGEGEG